MTAPDHPHLVLPRPRPDARLRLFLFHHAGGSHLVFRDWAARLPDDWEVCLLAYPGRLRLHRLPLPPSLAELAALLRPALDGRLDRPFAFFGHSMGALVAYQLTLELLRDGAPLPAWLGLSGFEAPNRAPKKTRERSLHRFDDAGLRRELAALGGTPAGFLDDEANWQAVARLIRADLALFETWRADPLAPTLPMPVSAFVGAQDRLVTEEGVTHWAYFTQRWLGHRRYEGDHFYFAADPAPLLAALQADVARALA
ncbi:thioesterase II family protein [Derxia lacustris]|uniref:thioesterase II family protein n=1 Tax=Derxia lacustris TaxID=764842 RepID=UPI000A171346|nr:alpha/beta fold hydrolase [Derxia lacustris]